MAAAGLAVTLLVTAGTAAQAQPSGEAQEQETYTVIPYVIADPVLAKDPGKIAAELKRAGNLDRLGVKPATGDKPSQIAGKAAAAAAPASYVVDSARFVNGANAADPYQYPDLVECAANSGQATLDARDAKKRWS